MTSSSSATHILRPSLPSIAAALLSLGSLASVGACDGSAEARDCFVHADCASGQCLSTGQCAALPDDGVDSTVFPSMDAAEDHDVSTTSPSDTVAGADEAGAGDATAPGETSAQTPDDSPAGAGAGAGCLPDGDGIVTRSEAPLGAGLTANFLVTTQVEGFSTTPDCDQEACSWDLVELDGETEEQLTETVAVEDQWFADDPAFADATYVTPMGEVNITAGLVEICNHTQLGVFQVTDDALLLLGMVSDTEDGGETLLVYDPPLPFLQFPLALGDGWQVETTASGPLCGSWVDYAIDQTYTVDVDEVGSLETPFGEFPSVLRVNALLERHMGLGVLPSVVRTQTFVAECFGGVAAIISEEGTDAPDFDDVSEVRRLTFLP